MRVRAFLLAVLVMALFPLTASANYPHVVEPGETLTSVARTDGLSVEAIAQANGMSPEAELIAGRILEIPPRTALNAGSERTSGESSTEAATSTESQGSQTEATSYSRSTTSTAATSEATTSESTTSTPESTTAADAAEGTPEPTEERVSGGEIAYVAGQYGVPASFAEAIAWQESGWNNAEVSGVGAVGVMQIVPATWDWIDRYLTPSAPLGTASAAENVRGGVLLLHQLLGLTGGSESLAAAGYFQGLASVKKYGMYPSTRQYVDDVLALAQRL
jgi:N-acetylmuramoyl-L-alanine amidase